MMQEPSGELDYSLVICTFNPEERILKRCLQAVSLLDRNLLTTEVILVDNNSRSPISEEPYIKAFEDSIPSMKIIHVEQPGVKYARMAAIRESRGRYIVYIDTDNEPQQDYLQQLKILNKNYPDVAAWGPGDVTVDFLDGVDKKLEFFARRAFQEKHKKSLAFDNRKHWQDSYPVGTGLCTFGFVLKDYVTEAESGRFSLPGRKGESLSSGEDTQMILLAISKGYSAGSSPTLKLQHLIPSSRANASYLKKLIFGTASCYQTCLLEVFPEMENMIKNQMMDSPTFTRRAWKKLLLAGYINNKFQFIEWLGLNAGYYYALNIPLPSFIQRLIKYLGVL
jgi:glycosyltransferase involved in cell wall biosynthesis